MSSFLFKLFYSWKVPFGRASLATELGCVPLSGYGLGFVIKITQTTVH